MRSRPLAYAGPGLVVALTLSACTGSGSAKQTSSPAGPSTTAVTVPSTTAAPSTTSAFATTTPRTVPPTAVPVDQIPPGHPRSWVPAGVPTSAKYKEPGDTVPKFSPLMFRRTASGVTAMFYYYVAAVNWAHAIVDPYPYTIVCTADACKRDVKSFADQRKAGTHWAGGRVSTDGYPTVSSNPNHLGSQWVVRNRIRVPTAKLVDRAGHVIRVEKSFSVTEAVYFRWNGRLWLVVDDQYEVPR